MQPDANLCFFKESESLAQTLILKSLYLKEIYLREIYLREMGLFTNYRVFCFTVVFLFRRFRVNTVENVNVDSIYNLKFNSVYLFGTNTWLFVG